MKNNQKGITLIALVITIIVLLILAGISIAMLTGENGILGRAKDAGADSKVGDAKEQVSLAVNDLISEYYDLKYVNNDNISGTASAYVGTHLADKFPANSDYVTSVAAGTATGAAHKLITLKPTDKDGKTVKGYYYTADGNSAVDNTKTVTAGTLEWKAE